MRCWLKSDAREKRGFPSQGHWARLCLARLHPPARVKRHYAFRLRVRLQPLLASTRPIPLPRNDVIASPRNEGAAIYRDTRSVILNSFQDLTYAKCSAKLKVGKMLNTDDNNCAPELSLQHDMAYRL